MKRILIIVAGIVGVLIGLGFIMPAVAWWRQSGPDASHVMLPLLLGGVLMLGGAVPVLMGARGSRH